MIALLAVIFANGSIRYKRRGNRWYVIDKVLGKTKPLRTWCYDWMLMMAALGNEGVA